MSLSHTSHVEFMKLFTSPCRVQGSRAMLVEKGELGKADKLDLEALELGEAAVKPGSNWRRNYRALSTPNQHGF